MTQAAIIFFFLVFSATASILNAQVVNECEYEMVVRTGPVKGPAYKLRVLIEAIGGQNINTVNVVKKWGDMGRGHTYFLPNSTDRFKSQGPCLKGNFCAILIEGGRKGIELKPHWYINNITIATKGEGVNRLKLFGPIEVEYTRPYTLEGECP